MKKVVSVAMINDEGKLLVEKHVKCKGLWVMPGGKVEDGETDYEAIVREMKEELGIDVTLQPLIEMFQRNSFYSRIDGDKIFDETVYAMKYDERCHGKIMNLEPEKHSMLQWIDPTSNYYENDGISKNTKLVLDIINSGMFPFTTPLIFNNPNFVYKSYSFDLSTLEEVLKMIEYIVEDDENLSLNVVQEVDNIITLTCDVLPTVFMPDNNTDVGRIVIPLKDMDVDIIKTHINNAKRCMLYRKIEKYLEESGINIDVINQIIPQHVNEEVIVRFDNFPIKIKKVLHESEIRFEVTLCQLHSQPCKLLESDLIADAMETHINSMYRKWVMHNKRNKVLVTKIHPEAIIPEKAHSTDSGMDLFAVGDYEIQPGKFCLVKTGIKIVLPEGYEAQVRPKSGLALKQGLTVLNTPGTVDEDYRGEVGVILINHSDATVFIKSQQKVAQMVISKVSHIPTIEVSNAEYLEFDTERGEGGFGSTGLSSKNK